MNLKYPGRIILLVSTLLAGACSSAGPSKNTATNPAAAGVSSDTGNIVHGCIETFDPEKDYFPDKAALEYAKVFSFEYHKSYKVVTVHETSEDGPGQQQEEQYVLLQCGAPKPVLAGSLASAPVVSIPITSLFAGSTTHHPLLVDLGRVDVLTGMPQHNSATSPEIIERIKTGKVVEYGTEATIDAEKVISQSPSMIMTSGPFAATYSVIRNAGIPVISDMEWLEDTALGRAEWIKFLALFLNEEAKGQKAFATPRDHYKSLIERTRNIAKKDRPKVMTGGVFRGAFTIAGGRSYVAKMIEDAGGDYLWSDNTSSGNAYVDLETAVVRASNADFWINGGPWTNLKSMLADEPRYTEFKAYRNGQVWLYNRKVNAAGSNDYWARGITRPDLILADMIKIFHPDLAADHEFEWYLQVPGS